MMNLLTQEGKKKIKKEYLAHLSVVLLFAVLVLVVLGIAALIPSWVVLNFRQNGFTTTLDLLNRNAPAEEIKALETTARDTGHKLQVLETKNPTPQLSEIIETIVKGRGTGVRLTSLTFLTQEKRTKLTLQGVAQTRTGLIQFIKTLESNPLFTHVESPLSNLVTEQNASFSLVLDVKSI